jgi:hypothetical protein
MSFLLGKMENECCWHPTRRAPENSSNTCVSGPSYPVASRSDLPSLREALAHHFKRQRSAERAQKKKMSTLGGT